MNESNSARFQKLQTGIVSKSSFDSKREPTIHIPYVASLRIIILNF